MATLKPFPSRKSYRLSSGVAFGGSKKWKQRYAKTKREGELRMLQARQLEEASRIQMASEEQIQGWIREHLLTAEEAIEAFPAYADLIQQRRQQGLELTDYEQIFDVYDEVSIARSKGGATGRTHTSNRSRANQIKEWLNLNVPSLDRMDAETVREYLAQVERRNSKKTAWHHLNVMRAMIDQALKLRMCRENVARSVHYRQPKPQRSRRILTRSEIDVILEAATLHPHLLKGALPVVIGMGLYAGMRDEEMIWSRWDRLNPETRVYEIGHTTCEVTGKVWYPKGTKARRVPFPPKLIALLDEEEKRQTEACTLGNFILSGRKPLHVDSPQQAFRKMIAGLNLSDEISIYSMRHTFATFLLRSPADGGAGKDIRTVQELMGHEDIKTTVIYLDFIKAEEHPSDALPY